jgi:hypothetical protein
VSAARETIDRPNNAAINNNVLIVVCANVAMLYHHWFAGETGMSMGVASGMVKAET